MDDWTQKRVAITGGNSGIGRAAAEEFHGRGATVALFGRNETTLAQAAEELPGVLTTAGDISRGEDVQRWYDELAHAWTHIDALVVNAGIAHFAPLESMPEEDLQSMLDVNVIGAYLTVQKALPLLRQGSSVVFTTSINAVLGRPGSSGYAASKAAQASMVRVFAGELVGKGIRVNGVRSGPVTTPMYDRLGMTQTETPDITETIANEVPMRRFGTPGEIAKAIAFLAGPDASYITGEELTVDGGMSHL
jgi:NAD(P)-dependent dehydrogenase (short-subunit alcohol dehydrogenase family)